METTTAVPFSIVTSESGNLKSFVQTLVKGEAGGYFLKVSERKK